MLGFLAHNLLKCAQWGLGGALSAILVHLNCAVEQSFVWITNMFRVQYDFCQEAAQF